MSFVFSTTQQSLLNELLEFQLEPRIGELYQQYKNKEHIKILHDALDMTINENTTCDDFKTMVTTIYGPFDDLNKQPHAILTTLFQLTHPSPGCKVAGYVAAICDKRIAKITDIELCKKAISLAASAHIAKTNDTYFNKALNEQHPTATTKSSSPLTFAASSSSPTAAASSSSADTDYEDDQVSSKNFNTHP